MNANMMVPEMLDIPPAIRAELVSKIESDWFAPSKRGTAAIEALPVAMDEGVVELIASGGAFGCYIEARLDRIEGRVAMEVLEWDRMSHEVHYRIWEDGSRESLTTYRWPTVENRRYNEQIDEILKQRGFNRRIADVNRDSCPGDTTR